MNSSATCPACGSHAVRDVNPRTGKEDAAPLHRAGWSLPGPGARTPPSISFSRNGQWISRGWAGARSESFYDDGLVMAPQDIFTLEARNTEFPCCGSNPAKAWGRQSVRNLFDAINERREVPLKRLSFRARHSAMSANRGQAARAPFPDFDSLRQTALKAGEGDAGGPRGHCRYRRDGPGGHRCDRGVLREGHNAKSLTRCSNTSPRSRFAEDESTSRRPIAGKDHRLHRVAGTAHAGRGQGAGRAARGERLRGSVSEEDGSSWWAGRGAGSKLAKGGGTRHRDTDGKRNSCQRVGRGWTQTELKCTILLKKFPAFLHCAYRC